MLQIVLGLFAVMFNFLRPCYAVLHRINGYTDSHGPGWKRIPRVIAEELHVACLLVSCAATNLRPSPYLLYGYRRPTLLLYVQVRALL